MKWISMFIVVSMLRKSMPKFQLHSVSASFMRQKWFQRDIRASCKELPLEVPDLRQALFICRLTLKLWHLVTFERCCFRLLFYLVHKLDGWLLKHPYRITLFFYLWQAKNSLCYFGAKHTLNIRKFTIIETNGNNILKTHAWELNFAHKKLHMMAFQNHPSDLAQVVGTQDSSPGETWSRSVSIKKLEKIKTVRNKLRFRPSEFKLSFIP
jgi:hypothetical protein